MKRFKLIFLSLALLLCGCSGDKAPEQLTENATAEESTAEINEPTPEYTDYSRLMECIYYNENMFHIYNSCAADYHSSAEILCGVAPHHLTAGSMIAGLYKAAAESRNDVETVVIAAPLHYPEMGSTCTAENGWATPFGALRNDNELSQIFADRLGAEKNDTLIQYDHAISSHIPFIKYYFPEAQTACLLISPEESGNFPERLAETLYEISEMKNCLFIFSIDFSHYLPPEEAEFHDGETLEAVITGNTVAIEEMGNDNVDTPYGLSAFVRLSEKLGGEITCADNSSTEKISGIPYNIHDYPEGVTSYFVFITE